MQLNNGDRREPSYPVAIPLAYDIPFQQYERWRDALVLGLVTNVGATQRYLVRQRMTLQQLLVKLRTSSERRIEAIRLMVAVTDADAEPGDPATDELTDDEIEEQVAEDFAERQDMLSGDNQLVEKLVKHTADSPILSGGDLDAAWDKADVGEETVGGTVATPDQDMVDQLGEAVGLTYDDTEPLNTDEKLEQRDRDRWQLDPRSAEDTGEERPNPPAESDVEAE